MYEQKVASGDLDAIAFIQGMSPVAWQHVNMFGSFEFSDEAPDVDLEALAARYAVKESEPEWGQTIYDSERENADLTAIWFALTRLESKCRKCGATCDYRLDAKLLDAAFHGANWRQAFSASWTRFVRRRSLKSRERIALTRAFIG